MLRGRVSVPLRACLRAFVPTSHPTRIPDGGGNTCTFYPPNRTAQPHAHPRTRTPQADIRGHFANGVDGCMLGRTARDDPFFFARLDSEVFGDPPPPVFLGGDVSSLEVWLRMRRETNQQQQK